MSYQPQTYDAVIPPAINSGIVEETKVLVVGAGPIGLAAALDLSLHGIDCILINRDTQLSDGSRAICYAKRPLEILDRLGLGNKMVEKGVSWHVGRVFFKDETEPVYSFDLLPVKDQKMPGMINIQQYYNEEFNIEALNQRDNVDLRWGNEIIAVEDQGENVIANISTEAGTYQIKCQYLIACDGARSTTRTLLDIPFEGETFRDNFLIADVKFKNERPTERHFWFDPPFNPGQSALLHKQPDDVWRIDFQVGRDIDRDEIVKPENITPRIKAMFGDDLEFEYEWISVYAFNCRKVDRMISGRVIFAGDSAHLVSPFGARGANTGFQDQDNLVWKLNLVMRELAPKALLETYNEERLPAAEINILNSTRSTDFITPKSKIASVFRDAVLQLSKRYEFARRFVNSGRLSTPVPYPWSSLNTPDQRPWPGGVEPGTNAIDAPMTENGRDVWLLDSLGWSFKALIFVGSGGLSASDKTALEALRAGPIPFDVVLVGEQSESLDAPFTYLEDIKEIAAARYCAAPGTTYLFRPDQYVAARWDTFDNNKLEQALKRATAN